MIEVLRNTISEYVSQYADLDNWMDVREKYGVYSYVAFLCLIANDINSANVFDEVIDIAKKNKIETLEILEYLKQVEAVDEIAREILVEANRQKKIDLSNLYQEYISVDFIIAENKLLFDGGKNGRDVLGAYYTQGEFAEEITLKAIEDFIIKNPKCKKEIDIADFSCGGSAFLIAAYRICCEKQIHANIYGYDVDPIAVILSRYTALIVEQCPFINVRVLLGNPLFEIDSSSDVKFKYAVSGRYYNCNMGIRINDKYDVVLGNPPWEKVRFEEKKFLHHFLPYSAVASKNDREKLLESASPENVYYYNCVCEDYNDIKRKLKKSSKLQMSNSGELNTYALFTELSQKSITENGIVGLIVKSSLVKMPVYSEYFKTLTANGIIYELYMFVNRKKIFSIDSREEFSVIYLSTKSDSALGIVLDLDDYKGFQDKTKIKIKYEDLEIINPETCMIPNIKNNYELQFLLYLAKKNNSFNEVYPDCKFGRLVHLTNHASFILRDEKKGYLPIYEGKFIEQYTSKYATFKGISKAEKYKNKASARLIENPQGIEYPESRYFIDKNVWENMSKNYDDRLLIVWRSLTSATNRRTMLASMLPLVPTCQSIQLLQLTDGKQMLHILALFNSIVFDYVVRLKMAGLDLTQTIIKQIPVPNVELYDSIIEFNGVTESISNHLIAHLRELYRDDHRFAEIFACYDTYDVNDDRKRIIANIDKLVAKLYSIDDNNLKKMALSFDKYYTKEEVENLY